MLFLTRRVNEHKSNCIRTISTQQVGDFMEEVPFTPRCTITKTAQGSIYTFFCQLSNVPVYSISPIQEEDTQKAEQLARKEARPYFNRCVSCGSWIGDRAYNIDVMQCIHCAPYAIEPKYCTECGYPVIKENHYCTRCGHQITEDEGAEGKPTVAT